MAIVDAVAATVGPSVRLIIEFHGRLAAPDAIRMLRKLEDYDILWCEEPVAPENLELLAEVKAATHLNISAGERLYTVADFYRLASLRACDVVQMDIAHCGGLLVSKKVAAISAAQDMSVSPHCSIGPVAFAAAIHFAYSTPNMTLQECFSEYDVDWRKDLVRGWDPIDGGKLKLPEGPGSGSTSTKTRSARTLTGRSHSLRYGTWDGARNSPDPLKFLSQQSERTRGRDNPHILRSFVSDIPGITGAAKSCHGEERLP